MAICVSLRGHSWGMGVGMYACELFVSHRAKQTTQCFNELFFHGKSEKNYQKDFESAIDRENANQASYQNLYIGHNDVIPSCF